MADQEYVEILRRGADVWNAWREKQSEIWTLDLSEVNFPGAVLPGVNLSSRSQNGINLSSANLSNANFSRANFYEANLTNTNLVGAILSDANFKRANIEGAKVTEAQAKLLREQGAMGTPIILAGSEEPQIEPAAELLKGFTEEDKARLEERRDRFIQSGRTANMPEGNAELLRRLEFVRWLVENGRISRDLPGTTQEPPQVQSGGQSHSSGDERPDPGLPPGFRGDDKSRGGR